MPNLFSITIDSGVLVIPNVAAPKIETIQYVEKLLDWKKLLEEPWVSIYMSERASESLTKDGLFPLRDQLKTLFNAHGIVEYDTNTVATIVNFLLMITPSFETYFRVTDVLTENLETDPDVIRLITHGNLQSDLERCITMIAVLRKHCSQPLGGHLLILREVFKPVVKVKAQILAIEHSRDDIKGLVCSPEFFEGDVLVCDDFRGLIKCLDESTILIGASDDFGVELAIRIALYKYDIEQGDFPDWSGMIVPTIGVKFREFCQQVCIDQGTSLPPKIIRTIVDTVKGKYLYAVHPLRTGVGGNNPQRIRDLDKAKAQRRDIDNEFHLHYWDCIDGTIELASVVYHNDFNIP